MSVAKLAMAHVRYHLDSARMALVIFPTSEEATIARDLAQALIESQQAIRSALRIAESINDAALYNVLSAALLEEDNNAAP